MQEKLEALIQTTVTGLDYELWGYEYRSHGESALLRIFIESPEGITVDDCGVVSQQLSAALDVEDLIPVAYILEVSSPGIDRVLFTPEHYQRYVGERLKVRTRQAIASRRNFIGLLESANEQSLVLLTDEGESYSIDYDVIDRGRLVLGKLETSKAPGKGKRNGVRS